MTVGYVIVSEVLGFPENCLSIYALSHSNLIFFLFPLGRIMLMEVIHYRKLLSWHSPKFFPDRKIKYSCLVLLSASGTFLFINLAGKVHYSDSVISDISEFFSCYFIHFVIQSPSSLQHRSLRWWRSQLYTFDLSF